MKGINTITANFSNGGRQCITRKLFQYDYGQKVLIKGLTLPQSFEFHISNSNSPKASSNIFLGNNNEIIIPDEYLTSGEDIYIWIFLHQTISDGQTRYTINIPIQKRPKAESKEPTQVEQNVIDQLISSLEQKVDEISAATEQAKDTFLKYPKIVSNYWYAYDIQTKNWINTEVKALGEDGLGIKNVSLNNDYTLTITFTDDTVFTTESIRGQKGQKGDTGVTPNLTIGTIETLPAEGYASVNIKGTAENPVLDFKIPRGYKGEKGDTGAMPNITIGTVNSLEPGSAPYVTQTGTAENPVLTFGLVKGEKGDTGEQGLQGPKGDKGDTGEQGPQGIQGETGATGPQGQKGDRGEQGIRGEQGNVGPRGQKGQTGATGPKGDTPVKGTDYWTAADKEQIIEDILTSQDITDLKDQIDSKEDTLNYSNPVQGFALTAKTIENGKVTEWDFGETGGIKMHICSSSEYSSESRIPIINNPDEKTIYLVPASYQPSNNMFTEWVYVNNTWEIFGSVAIDLSSYLTDVQINGTSIVSNGVADIPIATESSVGVCRADPNFGTGLYNQRIVVARAPNDYIKNGVNGYRPIIPLTQHLASFYGLAKVAGHDEKNSALPVGTYTDEAKAAIQTMLDVPSTGTVTGLQTSKADKSYVDTQLATKASTATATTSSDGLMSAQDKSKLDAVGSVVTVSGAPIVVTSASAMTDTSRIYVLTTDGQWYYYDGAAWTAGGEYGGVAAGSITTDKLADGAVTAGKIASGAVPVVDSTLTQTGAAADAKVVGDELSDLKSAINDMTTATAEDEGKALKAKTVSGGKVTEWEFGDAGSRVVIDYTLTQAGEAADAYAAGKALAKKVDYEFAFDVENGTEKYLNNSGIWKSDTRFFYSVSELIPCKEGYKYEYRVATYGGPVATVLFYQNNVFVSALTEYKGTITIPSGVNGVRFQSAKNSEPSLYVRQVYPKTFVEVEETIASIDKTVQNKADYDFVCEIESGSGKYIRPNGNTATDTRFYYKITNRIPCAPGDVFLYSGIGNTIYSASVLYYLDGSFVSGETYSKKRIITIPDGVNGVIFQSAKMSDDVQLSVQKLYPAIAKSILADKNNEKKVWATSNTGPAWETPRVPSGSPYGEIDFVTLFGDDSLYSLTLDSRWYCSTMPIPPYSIIDRVRFKSAASGNGQIVIASTEYIQSRYMVNVKVYNVTYSAGWNEVPIEFDVGEHDNYLIGHKNLNLLYADQTVLDGDVDSKYMFSNGTFYESNASSGTDAENTKFAFGTISNKKTCMAFDAHIYTGSVLEKLYKLTHHTGLPRLIDILKFKVIDGNIGYVGRWYNYSDNGDTYKIASSDGAYICFKVSGATAVSIEWGGTYLSKSCISYRIDNGDFVRDFVNPNGNTISIADTDEHIVQVVMDAIDVNWWNVGNGIGIKAIHTDGTLKAIKPANKRIIFFGDSLTQGVRALGVETTENPNCNSAINSYGWYMAKYLNANPIIVGYGSSGVTVNGSFSKCINAINYVANGIGTDDEQVDLIVINHGHNDASTSSNEFIAAYTDVLERFMTKYPAVPVMCVTPFNNAHASDVRVCAEAMPNCFFVDTSSWGLAQYYADGPGHLLAVGADYCGQKLAKEALNFGIF